MIHASMRLERFADAHRRHNGGSANPEQKWALDTRGTTVSETHRQAFPRHRLNFYRRPPFVAVSICRGSPVCFARRVEKGVLPGTPSGQSNARRDNLPDWQELWQSCCMESSVGCKGGLRRLHISTKCRLQAKRRSSLWQIVFRSTSAITSLWTDSAVTSISPERLSNPDFGPSAYASVPEQTQRACFLGRPIPWQPGMPKVATSPSARMIAD